MVLASSVAILVLASAAAYWRRHEIRSEAGWWATLIGLTIQLLLTIAIIAKHPGGIYLLAPAAILPLLLAMTLGTFNRASRWWKRLSLAISLVVILGFFLGLRVSLLQHARKVAAFRLDSQETATVIESAARSAGKDPASMLVLWSYGTESRCYALRFGNSYTEGVFDDEINESCPLDWTYEASIDTAELPGGYFSLADSTEWDILVIPANELPAKPEKYGRVVLSQSGRLAYIVAGRPPE